MRSISNKVSSLGVLLGVALLVVLISRIETTSDEHLKLLAKVPLGSNVQSIGPLLKESYVRGSSVTSKQTLSAGTHTQRLGTYEESGISVPEAKPFTGEVILFVEGPFGNDTAVSFSFKGGKLTKKDWGFLPG